MMPESSDRRWVVLRVVLGFVQLAGATTALGLLAQGGVSQSALIAVVATCVSTTVSVMLFGRGRPRGFG